MVSLAPSADSSQRIYYEFDHDSPPDEAANESVLVEGLRVDLAAVTKAIYSEVGCSGGQLAAVLAELCRKAAFHAATVASFEAWEVEAAARAEVLATKTRTKLAEMRVRVAEEKRASKAASTSASSKVRSPNGKVTEAEDTARVAFERVLCLESKVETMRKQVAEAAAIISTLENETETLRTNAKATICTAERWISTVKANVGGHRANIEGAAGSESFTLEVNILDVAGSEMRGVNRRATVSTAIVGVDISTAIVRNAAQGAVHLPDSQRNTAEEQQHKQAAVKVEAILTGVKL